MSLWRIDGTDYEDGKVTAIYVSHEFHGLDRAKFVLARPHGKWEWDEYDFDHNYGDILCSECSFIVYEDVPLTKLKDVTWCFCPKCGSDNRKEGEVK